MNFEVTDQKTKTKKKTSKTDWLKSKDNVKKEDPYWKCVTWSGETELELFGHRDMMSILKKGRKVV